MEQKHRKYWGRSKEGMFKDYGIIFYLLFILHIVRLKEEVLAEQWFLEKPELVNLGTVTKQFPCPDWLEKLFTARSHGK